MPTETENRKGFGVQFDLEVGFGVWGEAGTMPSAALGRSNEHCLK